MAACAAPKSYPPAVTFMSSIVVPCVPPQGTTYAKPIISRLRCEREMTRQSAQRPIRPLSEKGQFRTHAPQQSAMLFDHSVCATKSPGSRASPCTIWRSVLLNGDDHPVAARGPASPKDKQGAGERRARRRRTPHGPYLGAGVWLKSCSSATDRKYSAMLVLQLPEYFATLGKTQSGRVIWTAGGVSLTNLVATIVSGASPVSTQVTSGVSASNVLGPGPPEQWYIPGTMNSRA